MWHYRVKRMYFFKLLQHLGAYMVHLEDMLMFINQVFGKVALFQVVVLMESTGEGGE